MVDSRIVDIGNRIRKINLERSRLVNEIELLLRTDLTESQADDLEDMVESLGAYITRPWGSDDLVVKLSGNE